MHLTCGAPIPGTVTTTSDRSCVHSQCCFWIGVLLSALFGLSPLFVSRLILDFNNTTVCVENVTLTAATLDLYATVSGDFDRLRT